ncbi:hypothetical protein ABZ897_55300 [Nonomuraea sp. NPDC046802]|uniref:hypothetical protein n=1 Tax=Nonomuraea sp. NPDC046802 TaxID=3154919 RepID=UPI0034093DD3
MTAASRLFLDDLPDGTVKVPLGLPRGAAWPVVAQVAALSQRRAGCTASIGYLADRLGVHPSTIYDGLAAAGDWVVTDTSTSVTRRFLAPIPEDAAWARISYRAAAGVGCHSVDGIWTPRRNRSLLLELYCRLRRDEETGQVRNQTRLANDLGVTDRTVRSLLAALEADGWITGHRAGRLTAYRTHHAPLHVVDLSPLPSDVVSADEAEQGDTAQAEERSQPRSGKSSRNDPGSPSETISEAEPVQKHDDQAGCEKHDCSPLAVGDVQHRNDEGGDALPRERSKPGPDDRDEGNGSPAPTPTAAPSGVPGAPSVMCALPLEWQARMSEAERERVLTAIETELGKGKTVLEMTARVRRRLSVWRGQHVHRPVAAALMVVRRGYRCPQPMCEDHMLPSGHPCQACVMIGAQVIQERSASSAVSDEHGPDHSTPLRGAPEIVPAPVPPPPPPPLRTPLGDAGVDAVSSPRTVRAIAKARAELAALRMRRSA